MSAFSWLRSDPSLKIASLVLAVFVWMYVRSEEKPVQVFSVPLEVEGLPPDLALSGEVPDSVVLRVRAPDTTLRNLSPARFHARIRLDAARPGELTLPLTAGNVRAPLGVEVLRVDPANVSLRLERRLTREVPIVARIKGDPAPGYESDGYTLWPDRATIEGPEGIVRQVREAVSEEVDLGGRSASFETVVAVAPDRGGVRVASETAAVLRVSIREQWITRSYAGVPLVPDMPPGARYNVRFHPRAVTVVLAGTRDGLDAVTLENIKAVLDLEGMGPRAAAYAVKPRIVIAPAELGSSVVVHSVSEPTINVTISR